MRQQHLRRHHHHLRHNQQQAASSGIIGSAVAVPAASNSNSGISRTIATTRAAMKRQLSSSRGGDSSESATSSAAKTSYAILIFVSVVVVLMNAASMCQLGEFTTAKAAHLKLFQFQTRPAPPQYFMSTIRLFMPIAPRSDGIRSDLVKPGDTIYYIENDIPEWDMSPIVVEDFKLIFFTIPKVGCTVWKQLFRRMMGLPDWRHQDEEEGVPHSPYTNGLKYLYNYTLEEASRMMTDPEWTRAIMVRDPKHRFLSAFLDKAMGNYHKHIIKRCCPDESCVEGATESLGGFLRLAQRCEDGHWKPQHLRMESKFWPYVDHVGHVENAAHDARELLERVGAWESHGMSGWGPYHNQSIFESKDGEGGAGNHATWSQWKVWKWYTPETEALVESFYQSDYENPLFNFTRAVCITCE